LAPERLRPKQTFTGGSLWPDSGRRHRPHPTHRRHWRAPCSRSSEITCRRYS
jgi:hypothetical protein